MKIIKIEKTLKSFDIKPSTDWEQTTLNKLIALSNDDNVTENKSSLYEKIITLKFIFLNMNKKILLASFTLIIISLGFLGILIESNFQIKTGNVVYLEGEEKIQVLESIVRNNPELGDSQKEELSQNIYRSQEGFNYSKVTLEKGKQYTKCNHLKDNYSYIFSDPNVQYINVYSYNNRNEKMVFSKTESINKENDLRYLTMSKETEMGSELYEYNGGKYGYKQLFDFADLGINPIFNDEYSAGFSIYDDYLGFITSYFGSDPEVYTDGNNEYIIEYPVYVKCSLGKAEQRASDSKEVTDKILVKEVFDENFLMIRNESFLNSDTDDNLISRTTFANESKELSSEEAKEYFEFNYDIELKISPDPFKRMNLKEETDANYLLTLLKNEDIYILKSSDETYKFNVNESYDQFAGDFTAIYRYDRDFYSEDEYGQKLYDESMKFYNETTYSRSIVNQSIYLPEPYEQLSPENFDKFYKSEEFLRVFIDIFDKEKDINKMLNTYFFPEDKNKIKTEEIYLDIDDKEVKATVYKADIEAEARIYTENGDVFGKEVEKYNEEYHDCSKTTCYLTIRVVVFELNNKKYLIYNFDNLPMKDINKLQSMKLITLKPNDSADMSIIEKTIKESYMQP